MNALFKMDSVLFRGKVLSFSIDGEGGFHSSVE